MSLCEFLESIRPCLLLALGLLGGLWARLGSERVG